MTTIIYKKSLSGLLILLLSAVFSLSTYAQPWHELLPQDKLENGTLTFFDYQNAFNTYWAPYQVKEGYFIKDGVKDKAYGWKQFKRWEWFWEQRVDQKTGEFPERSAMEVFSEFNKTRDIQSNSGDWTSMGPTSSSGGYAGLGRLNCVAFHPSDDNTIYVGAAAGGVWKTTDGGSTWEPMSDTIAALGISDIKVVVINGDETVYIGTGDRDHSDTWSVGVLKSTDGGSTWSETGLNWTQNQYKLINRMLMDPDGPDTLYAATSSGLYQTIDGGDNWNLKTSTNFIDIKFQPGNTGQIYGSTKNGGIFKSTDYGNNWSQVLNVSNGKRTEIAVTADNDEVVYALMANSSSGLYGIYKSIDGGANFSQTFSGTTSNLLGWYCDGSGSGGQGWYDLCIESDPNNEDIVFIGGVNTWKSDDGGSGWDIVNHWSGNCGGQATNVHADKHFFAYQNGTSTLFECNDGGIYVTDDAGDSWDHLGSGLIISQMYRLGVAQTTSDDVITGLQDNGTKAMLSNDWDDVIGGDGMECLIDYSNEDIQYGSLYFGNIKRTTNHWANYTTISNGISGNAAWVTPYIIDKNDHETLYVGYQDVWKSTNKGDSWTKISSWGGSQLKSLAIAQNSDYIYAATNGTIYKTTDGGSNWSNISSGLPSSTLTYIWVKKDDPSTVWLTFSGFNDKGVYETTNGGTSWTNISSGLPELPVNCVIEDTSADEQTLYVGTDVGIYMKEGSADWVSFYTDLPNVVVTELDIYYDDNDESDSRIRASTFGRGLWESGLYTEGSAPATDFEADDTTPTIIDTVSFTDLSTNSPIEWSWDINPNNKTFLNGTDSTSQNPEVKFDALGYFTVSLVASNSDGTNTETKVDYIEVGAIAPEADFEADVTTVLVNNGVTFTDMSVNTPIEWEWEADPETITFLDGTDQYSQNPVIGFDEAGFYSVTLTASNTAGSDNEIKIDYIEVVDVLDATASADPGEICFGDTVYLEAEVSGGSGNFEFEWSSDPSGFVSEEQSPIAIPQETTNYFVNVSDGFQESDAEVQVIVNSLPIITLGDWPEIICNEEEPPMQLTATPENGVFSGEVTPEGVFTPEEAPLGWNVIIYTFIDDNDCEASSQDSIFVDECVGIINNSKDNQNLVIYPNPNTGEFTVESTLTIQKIELINQLGRVVYSLDVDNYSTKLKVNLNKGIYFIRAYINGNEKMSVVNEKIIIR